MYKSLNNEELIKLYRETKDEEVREYFFEVNFKLACSIANKFLVPNSELKEELKSEALIELIAAFNTFDSNNSCKFSTYAGVHIKNKLITYINRFYRKSVPPTVGMLETIGNGEDALVIEETLNSDTCSADFYVIAKERLKKFMDIASDLDKKIYYWSIKEELSQVKVAEKLGVTKWEVVKTLTKLRNTDYVLD